jgi:hypothetical protein
MSPSIGPDPAPWQRCRVIDFAPLVDANRSAADKRCDSRASRVAAWRGRTPDSRADSVKCRFESTRRTQVALGSGTSRPTHPTTLAEVQAIVDGKLFENVHLEFKASDALNSPKAVEIAKDVSAFANSDGGTIVCGIAERNHQADQIDAGVDVSTHNREWLENVIQSNVSPRLDGVLIEEIAIAPSRAVVVVHVPRSDHCIENVGDVPALDIQIITDPVLVWPNGEPPVIKNGVKSLQPRQRIAYMYAGTYQAFAAGSSVVKEFTAKATYTHVGANKRISDAFYIDLNSLAHSLVPRTDIERHGSKLEDAIGKLATEVMKVGEKLERLKPLAGPSGLALSYTTLRAVAKLVGVDFALNQLDPKLYSWEGIQEILGVEDQVAISLHRLFAGYLPDKKLDDIDGMTPELLELIKARFRVDAT